MKVTVELDGYEMGRLFGKEKEKKAQLFAQNIIDRYCNGEYLCEDELIEEE
jgi:hypothetical protein